ncbi:pseudaminic acid synthase [Pseudomonas sp. C9-3]|uniref:pseudaminic acid synthase n=1 Tax=Pseudomonas sp. C9-3 TaxID=3078264 RepID=UPI0028EB15E1|nr:pseudaminic acid synthase [Pseudomonas sp. C9-3]
MTTLPSISIAGRRIAEDCPPYIIAELSANHNGRLETALRIIEEAHKAGADAIKLQTYTADTITLNCDSEEFQIHGGLWDGKTLYQLYQEAQMPWEWHKPLFEHAHKVGITIFSSPFDNTAVDLLESLNAPAYKIASFEAVDLPLIKYVASTGKPMIISTGMADVDEIGEAIEAAREGGCRELAILRCVSGYPASAEEYNLHTITDMKRSFGVVTGLSDHTLESITAITSVALGASIIEKHFTLNRKGGGADDSFSIEPSELEALCQNTKLAWSTLGKVDYGKKSSELGNSKFRRSLYFTKEISKNEIIGSDAVKSIRPGFGVSPKHLSKVIGNRATVDIQPNTPVKSEYLKSPIH